MRIVQYTENRYSDYFVNDSGLQCWYFMQDIVNHIVLKFPGIGLNMVTSCRYVQG